MARTDLGDVQAFTTVAVGRPGARVFHLQVRSGTSVVTIRCEKAQVAALAEYLSRLLADLPDPVDTPPQDALAAFEPLLPEFVLGSIGVAYDLDDERVVVHFEEIDLSDDEDDEDDEDLAAGLLSGLGEGPERASVRVALTRGLARAFIEHATGVVLAGRPTCRFCGRPMDPGGHPCPRMN
jgi:uncharacterized repeat protein (TIGR03847 family)